MNENTKPDPKDKLPHKEPVTMADKLKAGVLALVLIGFCVAVWRVPDLLNVDPADFSARGGRKIARMLNWLWSRPMATLAGLLGLLVGWGALTAKVDAVHQVD